ncbi:MAG: YfhO family protein [Chlorobi bacterium]|nr:YfhO family protein [Chlorobiota bacterium]
MTNKLDKSKYYIHLIIVAIFLFISYIYCSPQLEGKKLRTQDGINYEGMAKEAKDFHKKTGDYALWTNSMFGGMPTYLISLPHPENLFKAVVNFYSTIIKRPAIFIFLYLIGFYLTLLMFGVNPWLSMIGAIGFAFSSYFFIILGAGHYSKALAIAYMSPTIASIYYAYEKKHIWGSILFGVFFSIELLMGHFQITYYALLVILLYVLFKLINDIKEKQLKEFTRTTGYVFIAALLAVGSNFSSLYLTYDYGKDSMRGKSELSHDKDNKTGGLDKDYATAWSYGVDETLTLLIPDFKGGSSGGALSKKSAVYKLFERSQGKSYAQKIIKQMPLYWGTQPFTSGPVYLGSIILFIFVLGLFIIKGRLKWWILTATILALLLAWGKNFMFFTNLFLDYFPGYNKFRTVSMILVVVEFTVPLLAFISLQKILNSEIEKKVLFKYIKYSFFIVGGISLFFALFPGMFFDFKAPSDQNYINQGGQMFVDALKQDRLSLLQMDSFRSLAFVTISGIILLAFIYNKINKTTAIVLLGVFILFDMWPVDKRYFNNDNFVSKRKADVPYVPTNADKLILKDTDPDFRVLNLIVNTFNDASTSYFHKSIGGYHGAKMKRYQELIDYHISKQNMKVLNMLNTKYFILPGDNNQPQVQINMAALGNAWFVNNYKLVENADEEIQSLYDFEPAKTAIVDKRFKDYFKDFNPIPDSTATIQLIKYSPNELNYKTKNVSEQLAVFSEIYYSKGWKAYIDGNLTPHIRVNYVLRALRIPAGEHEITFKFQPKAYKIGNVVSLISSWILIISFLVYILFLYSKNKKEKRLAKNL